MCVIDATEFRDVVFVTIPGSFLHAAMDEVVHVRFEGTLSYTIQR